MTSAPVGVSVHVRLAPIDSAVLYDAIDSIEQAYQYKNLEIVGPGGSMTVRLRNAVPEEATSSSSSSSSSSTSTSTSTSREKPVDATKAAVEVEVEARSRGSPE